MEFDVSKYPAFLRRILKNEDSILGNLVIWYLAVTVFPAGAFYIGTISSDYSNAHGMRHYYDLRVNDMHVGGYFALGGLAIGICWGLWATFVYPKKKEQDAIEDEETAARIHHLLSHHDVISTDVGQQAEHVLDHPTSLE